jgi:predicted SAM-dependent methyltransferase
VGGSARQAPYAAAFENQPGRDAAIGSRRIELGGGPYPLPGFLHVDADWQGNHLEAIASADHLPFRDDFAEEIVAIHLLEHIHPTVLTTVLAEWRRVLAPGGVLQVHVPDFEVLAAGFLLAEGHEKWKFMSAILGMYSAADATSPMDIRSLPDHKLLLNWATLEMILKDAGFVEIENVSAAVRDRHTEGWAAVVEQISLVARAINPR